MSENSQNTSKKFKENGIKCKFFVSNSHCRFGDNCRFLHPVTEESWKEATNNSKTSLSNSKEVPNHKTRTKQCKEFAKSGSCRFGANCRFSHNSQFSNAPKPEATSKHDPKISTILKTNNDEVSDTRDLQPSKEPNKGTSPKKVICRHFTLGRCRYGHRCGYHHPKANITLNNQDGEDSVPEQPDRYSENKGRTTAYIPPHRSFPIRPVSRPVIKASLEHQLANLTIDYQKSLRKTEIENLGKRYRSGILKTLDKGSEFTFNFIPSDPDWPYDLRHMRLRLLLSEDYPKDVLEVLVLNYEEEDLQLPEVLQKYTQRQINQWIKKRFERLQGHGRVETVVKPLLRWVDRALEDIFLEGLKMYQRQLMAKAAGMEFVSASELQDKFNTVSSSDEAESNDDEEDDADDDDEEDEEDEDNEEDRDVEEDEQQQPITGNLERKGTEVKLINLQLLDAAATLRIMRYKLVIECARCAQRTDVSCNAGHLSQVECDKCHTVQLLQLRPSIAHAYSSVIGYFDLENCRAFDLVLTECAFMVGCLHCSMEFKLEGLAHGQVNATWCRKCNQKVKIAAETARFLQLTTADTLDATNAVKIKGKKRLARDPNIKAGEPLPAQGTCKHYKKSYRWLRFPCCGKAYPCDLCHDAAESDHEMLLANRMICGFCAKEQRFAADKPCIACDSNMTKKSSSHWEGGRGCRNTITMSRNDVHKYSNMNKTVSKKATAKGQTNKKKKTILRHK